MDHPTSVLKEIIASSFTAHPALTAALSGTIVLSLFLSILPPLVLQRAIDALTNGKAESSLLLFWGLLYFILTALSGLSEGIRETLITMFGQAVTKRIRQAMAAKLSRLPAAFFTGRGEGSTASLFVNDVDTLEDLFDSGIISMAVDSCRLFSILVAVYWLSFGLFLLLLAALPFLFLLTRAFQHHMLAAQIENRKAIAATNELIPETCRNIRTIRLLSCEYFMKKRYAAAIKKSFQSMEKTNFYDSIYSPIILTTSALLISLMAILSVSPEGATLFGMTAGTAAALIAYVGKIFSPLESLGMEIENIQSAMAGVHRIREFMEEEEMALPKEKGKKNDLPLRISHLSFAYEKDHPLFKDFSLTLEAGCHLTLTGRTGSGKSTLFKLITGLCLPDSGTIALFGMNPAAIPPKERRKIFGIVSQSFPMIDGTVRDQITLGDMRITDTMTASALRISGLYETVMALPQKLDTPFQDSLFSEGEKQLLSIARALVFQPPLLLLDEMNAHLDSLTEQKVLRALSRASSNRTVLSISHRLGKTCQGPVLRIGEGRGEGRP
jgi:ATP-binding cassette, subfamily B, multidrug efflux pump